VDFKFCTSVDNLECPLVCLDGLRSIYTVTDSNAQLKIFTMPLLPGLLSNRPRTLAIDFLKRSFKKRD
jgi:hypothetical protein